MSSIDYVLYFLTVCKIRRHTKIGRGSGRSHFCVIFTISSLGKIELKNHKNRMEK